MPTDTISIQVPCTAANGTLSWAGKNLSVFSTYAVAKSGPNVLVGTSQNGQSPRRYTWESLTKTPVRDEPGKSKFYFYPGRDSINKQFRQFSVTEGDSVHLIQMHCIPVGTASGIAIDHTKAYGGVVASLNAWKDSAEGRRALA